MTNDTFIAILVCSLVAVVVALLYICYRIKKYKDKQIKMYGNVIKSCTKSIDIFIEEGKKLNRITECLVNEMQQFKNSEVYKDYKNKN